MRIILLDDSKTVLLTIQLLLEEKGVKKEDIYLFSEGEKALSFINEKGADLIFTDMQMPGMDGYEFVQRLFELSNDFSSSLIVVSADNDSKETARMKSIGVKYFINKPIDFNHFHTFVSSFLPQTLQSVPALQEDLKPPFTHNTAINGIEFEAMAISMGVGVKHIPKLLKSFISESLLQLENFKSAIPTFNYEEIERSMHSIKGSAGNMKFDSIYKTAKLTEIAGHLKEEMFDYQGHYDKLKKEIEEIAVQIKTE